MMKDFMIEKERNKELSNELLFYRKEFDEISKDSVIKVLNLEWIWFYLIFMYNAKFFKVKISA
jgi:hypothetical protein